HPKSEPGHGGRGAAPRLHSVGGLHVRPCSVLRRHLLPRPVFLHRAVHWLVDRREPDESRRLHLGTGQRRHRYVVHPGAAQRAGLGTAVTTLPLATALSIGANPANNSNGQVFPDFGVALKWDQAWGSIGAFGVGHDASAAYYSTLPGGVACFGGASVTTCGHP